MIMTIIIHVIQREALKVKPHAKIKDIVIQNPPWFLGLHYVIKISFKIHGFEFTAGSSPAASSLVCRAKVIIYHHVASLVFILFSVFNEDVAQLQRIELKTEFKL